MAISLADEDGAFYLEAIEEFAKQKIPTEWAEDDMFVHDYVRTKQRPREAVPAGKERSRPWNTASRWAETAREGGFSAARHSRSPASNRRGCGCGKEKTPPPAQEEKTGRRYAGSGLESGEMEFSMEEMNL